MGDQHYGCSFDEEHLNNEIDRLVNEVNELEKQVKKMVKIICKCLRATAFKDAYEYMKERNAPMTKWKSWDIFINSSKSLGN